MSTPDPTAAVPVTRAGPCPAASAPSEARAGSSPCLSCSGCAARSCRRIRRWETAQEMPANTQPFPWAWCSATGTMFLQGNPIFCLFCPAPRPRCQTLLNQVPLDTATAEPCRCLESPWLPAVPACQQCGGLWVFIAYSDSCLISSRAQALAHVLPGWAQARGGTRGGTGHLHPRRLVPPSVGTRVVRILVDLEALGARGALQGLLDPCHGHMDGSVCGTGVGQKSG